MKQLLTDLFNGKILSTKEAHNALLNISREAYTPAQVASFMTVYQMRPITADELKGFRNALLELRVPIDLEGMESIDIVGTGGDGKDTFNISTTSAFVVAGAGYKVTKHGSYGVSSSSGSSDVLMALGYQFTNDRDILMQQLDRANICFMHAPLFHPAMKAVVPIRKELKLKTFFNMLGPLVNPARPKYQLFGTFNLDIFHLYRDILRADKSEFTVLYALDGYDEISLTSAFKMASLREENLLSPTDLGLPTYQQSDLHGGNGAADAKKIMLSVLGNTATNAQRDVVIANAGMAIHSMKPTANLADCLAEARESLGTGRALEVLEKVVKS